MISTRVGDTSPALVSWRMTALCVLVVCGSTALAESLNLNFDGPANSWKITSNAEQIRIARHIRQPNGKQGGCESIDMISRQPDAPVRLEQEVTPARVIEELEVKVWVKCSQPGVVLGLRLVFPEIADPRTGDPLTTILPGTVYREVGEWQQLTCRTTETQVKERLRIQRALLDRKITPRQMYVDRVVLGVNLPPGNHSLMIDELEFGPIVRPEQIIEASMSTTTDSAQAAAVAPPVEFRLDRMTVEKKPFFPRMVPYRGEHIDKLASAGVNVAWINNADDTRLLSRLQQQGIWATATPPRIEDESGELLTSRQAGLVPFPQQSRPILFWMLGTRTPSAAHDRLSSWIQQVQDADRIYKRPIAADILEGEKSYSRQIDLIGISRHNAMTSETPREWQAWMLARRRLVRPGTFCWTWLQTEPPEEFANAPHTPEFYPQMESETLRTEVYAAIAAGVRGLGFWTTNPLDAETPGNQERLLTLRELNLELQLIEPWLATSTNPTTIPVRIEKPSAAVVTQEDRPWQKPIASDANHGDDSLAATVLRADLGTLIIPNWLQEGAQCVPGPMSASEISFIVPGSHEATSAWLVSTTEVRSLPREHVTGGLKVSIRDFDQTALVVVTSDPTIRLKLREQVETFQERSAKTYQELAALKLERVRLVEQELSQMKLGHRDAPMILGQSRLLIDQSKQEISRKNWHSARTKSQTVIRLLRTLQRDSWNQAVRSLESPSGSHLALCYQSLPDHWRMITKLGQSSNQRSRNALEDGDFEDWNALVRSGWNYEAASLDGLHCAAELYPVAATGKYSLRLACTPTRGALPTNLVLPPVIVHSAQVHVEPGQVIQITGRMRLVDRQHSDGEAYVSESILGRVGRLRLKPTMEWQRFELLRETNTSRDIKVTLALQSAGDVLIDDLRIIIHDVEGARGRARTNQP